MDVYQTVYQAAAKEWYWLVIFGSIVAMAWAPTFLKAKCPQCKKRKMESVDLDQSVREEIQRKEQRPFLTFYRCNGCGARLMRERSAPYQDASDPRWNLAYEKAFTTIAS